MPSIRGTFSATVLVLVAAACGAPGPTLTTQPTPTTAPTAAPSGQPTQTGQSTPSTEPTSTAAPTPTAEAGWITLAAAPDVNAAWSPDGAHVAVSLFHAVGGVGSQSVSLFTRAGEPVRTFEGLNDPVWLDAERFVAYRLEWRLDEGGTWFVVTGPDGERQGSVVEGRVDSEELQELDIPLWPATSNGRGALALTGFDDAGVPQTQVWSDGVLGEWREGRPEGWSAAGDRLSLIHVRRSGPADEGWVEIVDWPAMTTAWASDESLSVGTVLFDPTGSFVAYPEFTELPTPPRQVPQFELTVRIADLASGGMGGFVAQENGQFAWDTDGNVTVVGFDSMHAVSYDRGGAVLAEGDVIGPNVISSADGSTLLFYDAELDQPPMQVTRGDVLRELDSPGTLYGPPPSLAADGSGVLLTALLPSRPPGGPPATVLLHNL